MIFLALAFLQFLAQLTAPPTHGPYQYCATSSDKYGYCVYRDGNIEVIAGDPFPTKKQEHRDDLQCLVVDSLTVSSGKWHVRAHNGCDSRTAKSIYVRLAFYDASDFRHGFTWFTIEPMAAGERVRLDQAVPRKGAARAEVYMLTLDTAEALTWGMP